MAETVGQHSVAAFTSPVNGTSPIDANTVKGNDNTIRSAYVDHDADPGIHVQSSTLASRPVANSAGRKWMTQDSGVIRLFYDDGTSWYEVDYLRTTGGTISGNLSITGTLAVTGVATFTAQPILSSLTASRAVFTDGSKGLVSNAITGTGDVVMSASPTLTGTITAASATLSGTLGVSGLLTFASLKGTGATTVTNILDEDNMASDSATALATQQSIKAYVDAQVGASDALSEVLAIGNTTGANDIIVSAGQKIRTPAVAAQDGSSAITIANTTGALTLATALADSNLATISTAGKVSNSATTATDANTASAIVARDASGNFTAGTITAALTGNASTATTLQTARNINGVSFNGSADITVTAAAGTLTGTTLASNVTASSLTSVGTLANLTVTNPITGSVTGSSGSTTGNAATATALQTARNINGVSFNGTADITVTAAAGTLTGTTLASGVTASSLTSVGTLSSLAVTGDLTVDTSTLKVDSTNNRVGIGTATPASALEVNGAGRFGADGASVSLYTSQGIRQTGTGGFYIDANSGGSAGGIYFRDGSGFATRASIDASGNLAVDTNTLYVDAANNRVGVGTASPAAPLHVAQSSSAVLFSQDSTTATIVGTNAAGNSSQGLFLRGFPLTFTGNGGGGAEQMRLDASGNLGLGVTPSVTTASRLFEIGFAGSGVTAFGQTATVYTQNAYNNSGWKYGGTGQAMLYAMDAGVHSWYTAASGTAGNAISFTQAMTLDASTRGILTVGPSGSVGSIGTDYATVGVWNTAGGGYRIYRGTGAGTSSAIFYADSSTTTIGSSENLPFVLQTNSTERARITAGGDLQIGGTNGTYQVNITQSAGDMIRMFRDTSNTVEMFTSSSSTNVFYITVDNSQGVSLTSGNTSWGSYSDARLKNVTGLYTNALSDVAQLEPVKFTWKSDEDNKPHVGLLAQSVAPVIPEAVDTDENGMMSVRYTEVIPLLVAAIKELKATNESLEARLAALESK